MSSESDHLDEKVPIKSLEIVLGRADTELNDNQEAAMPYAHDDSAHKRKKKLACIECRQQKAKCDAHEKFPDPCNRCLKRDISCVVKQDFRRTYKRAKSAAIEKRFEELADSLTLNPAPAELLKQFASFDRDAFKEGRKPRKSGTISTENKPSVIKSDTEPMSTPHPQEQQATHETELFSRDNQLNDDLVEKLSLCTTKTLGDVTLENSQISELYTEFLTKYHSFLPIVDVLKGPETIYNLSPCLFWVIMLIGLRRKQNLQQVSKTLSPLVKSVLAEITISPIIRYLPHESDNPILNVASVYSVQAFLLYSFWPSLTSSLSADTSWNTIGSACFQAIRLGLNSAQYSAEYKTANLEFIDEQIKTWVSCNTVSQIIASTFGFPSYVSFDHSVLSNCRLHNFTNTTAMNLNGALKKSIFYVPSPIKQMMQIAHFQHQVTQTMGSNKLDPFGIVDEQEKLPLLSVLENQLHELDIRLQNDNLDDIRKFLLLVSKVYLFAYYFNNSKKTQTENEKQDNSNFNTDYKNNIGLVKVYNAAIELLNHADSIWKSNPHTIKYFPGVFVLNIWQAACIICKLVHSSLSPMIDIQLGKKYYNIAVSLTFNASVMKFDLAYRSSRIMKGIWLMYKQLHQTWLENKKLKTGVNSQISGINNKFGDEYNLELTIQSRLSVSVFFDCLYMLKQQTGLVKNLKKLKQKDEKEADLKRGEAFVADGKESATEIMTTIPLDPEPINAPVSSSSAITSTNTTPNNNVSIPKEPMGKSDVLSLKNILNKNSPKDNKSWKKDQLEEEKNTEPQSTITNAAEDAVESLDETQKPLDVNDIESGDHELDLNLRRRADIENNNIVTTTNGHTQEQSKLQGESSTRHINDQEYQFLTLGLPNPAVPNSTNTTMNNTNTTASSSSSNNGTDAFTSNDDLFSYLETDPLWEDVDLLLNEFAFNPTV